MTKEDERESRRQLYGPFWAAMYVNLNSRLIGFAKTLTKGDTYEAEELVQEAICRVFCYSPNPAKIKNPLSYLMKTLKNLWIDKFKKSRGIKMQSIDDENNQALLNELPRIEPSAERLLKNQEFKKEIRIATGNLEPLQKSIIGLYLQGYDCEEIAVILKRDIYRIKYELNAVRAKIRYRISRQTRENDS